MAGTSDQIRASRRSASDRGQSLTVSNAGPGHESNQLGCTTNKDPNTLNLDPDPEFWPNLYPDPSPDPDPGLWYKF